MRNGSCRAVCHVPRCWECSLQILYLRTDRQDKRRTIKDDDRCWRINPCLILYLRRRLSFFLPECRLVHA